MRRLGRKYLAILGAGVIAVLSAAIAGVLGWIGSSLVALAIALGCLFAALTLLRLDLGALAAPSRRPLASADGAATEQREFENHLRTQVRIAADLERMRTEVAEDVAAELRRAAVRDADSRVAVAQLVARHDYRGAVGFENHDVNPRQVLEVLELVRTYRPARVLVISAADLAVWLGYEMDATGGQALAVAPSEDAGLLAAAAARHGLSERVTVAALAQVDHELPQAVLPWFDLAALAAGETFDLVVLDATTPREQRAVLPLLSLLTERLAKDGKLAVLTSADDIDRSRDSALVEGWERRPEVQLEPELSSPSLTVFGAAA